MAAKFYLADINEEGFYQSLKWIEHNMGCTLEMLPDDIRNLWINPYFYLMDVAPTKEDPRFAIFSFGYKFNNPSCDNKKDSESEELTRNELKRLYAIWQMKLNFSVLVDSGVFKPSAKKIKIFNFNEEEKMELELLLGFWKEVSNI